jgi:methyl-accepting chemotaxis protein
MEKGNQPQSEFLYSGALMTQQHDNLWTRVRQSIFDQYENESYLQQQRAWFLFTYGVIYGLICFIFSLLLLAAGEKGGATNLFVALLFFLGSALVRFRRYRLSSHMLMIFNVAIVTYGAYDTYTSPVIFDGFTTYFLYCPAFIVFAALFRNRKTVFLVYGWYTIVIIIYFIALRGHLNVADEETVKKMFMFGLTSLIMTTVLSSLLVTAMQRSNRNLVDSVSDVREASEKMTGVSSVIGDSSKVMAEGASAQAAAMEETASSLKEIFEKTKKNEKTVQEARQLMRNAMGVIAATQESLGRLKASLEQVNRQSEKTASVVQSIDTIAFQTNLLALNAAVEAAHAGDSGAGFAVVADEVRNLARKSAEAARTTQGIIEESIGGVRESDALARESNDAFSKFAAVANKLEDYHNAIAELSEEQTAGIAEIEKAIAGINDVVQENAAGAQEITSVSEELIGMSESIKTFVVKLDRLVQT